MTNDPSTDAATDHVTITMDEADVATILIDDGKANALSHGVLGGIEAALDEVERREARSVAIIGREGKFSAGFDLAVMTSGPANARDLLGRGAELGLRLFEFPIPTVLGVTGHALAMGGILLACGDVRIGARGPFKLGLPEVRIGMPVPAFAVELCRDRFSTNWYTRAVQLGQSLTPEQAVEAGMLDEVTEPGEVRSRAVQVATELAEAVHPGPFRATRQIMRGGLAAELREALAADLAAFTVEPG